jgi:hydroxypyruvate reductase
MRPSDPRSLLRALFDAALAAADPGPATLRALGPRPPGQVLVVGAGKAAAPMVAAVEEAWGPPLDGLVVTRHGHGAPTRHVPLVEGGHPVPDAAGCAAAARILDLVREAGPETHVLVLISGGGSSLLALPALGLSLADKQAANRALVASGAAIDEINVVRKHISAIKGGRLAAACRAPLRALVVSDVAGDDPSVIASGPTLGDPSTFADARAIVARHRITLPRAVADHLARGTDETPKPGDPRLARATTEVIVRPRDALDAAAALARRWGLDVVDLGDAVAGEAAEVGRTHAGLARARSGRRPSLILSGGELTVTAGGAKGRGGPSKEYAIGLAMVLDGAAGIHALAGDSDGIDGSSDDAGAFVGPDTLARARALGRDPGATLAAHDSRGFFEALGDLLVTGPTRTNVNDIRLILIEG